MSDSMTWLRRTVLALLQRGDEKIFHSTNRDFTELAGEGLRDAGKIVSWCERERRDPLWQMNVLATERRLWVQLFTLATNGR